MKTSKFVNIILELSQVLLVFFGVYSAIMCAALSLSVPVNQPVTAVVLLGASFLFYGLFTVLETFPHGKLYGMLGISVFALIVMLRFRSVVQKGLVTIINTYLKEFMNYTQGTVTLVSNKGFQQETASVEYCSTLVIIVVAVYLTALISGCFYRKRRSAVYVLSTVGFFVIPLTVGKIGYFSNVVVYLFITVAVIGTRFLRYDTTDKRMRQKLSLVLVSVGIVASAVTYLFLSPQRYSNHLNDIVEIRNSALSITTWERDDIMTWVRGYLSGDAIDYGRVGRHSQVNRTGKTLLKIKGDFDITHGLYLKGYTGAEYSQNRWRQIKDEQYQQQWDALSSNGLSLDNWHVTLRNQIGDSQTTGNEKLWSTGKITVKNLAFGFGNYVVPYFPTVTFSNEGGRSTVLVPGVQYEAEYYPVLYSELKKGLVGNKYKLAENDFWVRSQGNREKLLEFARKYYVKVPEETAGVIEEYKSYLNSQDGLLDKWNDGSASLYRIIEETRNFIMNDTEYTLSPGKTPKDEDSVVYFLKENKKGYCVHYATAAAVLLRGIGIPTRYIEGLYVSKEQLADVLGTNTELEVTDEDIHAWVEVYQENYGFVPMEFTPGRGDEDTADDSSVTDGQDEEKKGAGGAKGTPGDAADPEDLSVTGPTPEPEDDMTFENIESDHYNREEDEEKRPDAASEGAVSGKDKGENSHPMAWWRIAIAVLFLVLLLVVAAEVQRRVRILLFKRNVRRKTKRKQILVYYRHLDKAFVDKGIRYRGQSVGEYTEQIASHYGLREEIVYPFISMVFCASFSYEKFDKEQIAEFRTAYRSIRHKVYEEVKGIKKLYYMYILCI